MSTFGAQGRDGGRNTPVSVPSTGLNSTPQFSSVDPSRRLAAKACEPNARISARACHRAGRIGATSPSRPRRPGALARAHMFERTGNAEEAQQHCALERNSDDRGCRSGDHHQQVNSKGGLPPQSGQRAPGGRKPASNIDELQSKPRQNDKPLDRQPCADGG